MTQKHTPGPWVAKIRDTHIPNCVAAYIETRGEYRGDVAMLQSCENIGGITQDETRANAHLIAAAPDLLEALLEARAYVPEHHGPAVHKIRAAIAKAEGLE